MLETKTGIILIYNVEKQCFIMEQTPNSLVMIGADEMDILPQDSFNRANVWKLCSSERLA